MTKIKGDPPDKYKCIKLPLSKIFKSTDKKDKNYNVHNEHSQNITNIIFDAVLRTNKIIRKTYLLIKLYILDYYQTNFEVPYIDEEFIVLCIQTLNLKAYKPKEKNIVLFNKLKSLYSFKAEDGTNLTQILNYKKTTILTMIENNIKNNFFNYIRRYINAYFYSLYKDDLENKVIDKKTLKKELKKVKDDLIFDTLNSNIKYHSWIKEYKSKILPLLDSEISEDNNYSFDIKVNPQKYLKHMIWMNIEIESLDKKLFQILPLQNSMIPTYIDIDTNSIIELFITNGTNKYKDSITDSKKYLWNSIFKINQKLKGYSFDYNIATDGFTVSLRFIKNDLIESKQKRIKNMLDVRNKLSKMTEEEKEEYKINAAEKQLQLRKEKAKIKTSCICGAVVKQSSLSSHKKSKKHKKYLEDNKIIENIEFPYITEVNKDELICAKNRIYCDPGKSSLLTMVDDNNNFFRYSNKQRLKTTKRIEYNKYFEKYKNKKGISKIENELSEYNSKTCDLEKFRLFITKKLKINSKLEMLYKDTKFRQYKFYSYINRKRSESKLLHTIKKKFGEDTIVIMGDWSIGKQMRNYISTPNLGLKRKINEKFKVYSIDEYNTSCINYRTEENVENLKVRDWYENKVLKKYKNKIEKITEEEKSIILTNKNKTRELHHVLTFKMENNRKGCINRDRNACLNMKKIYKYYIETGERPTVYCRPIKNAQPSVQSELLSSESFAGNIEGQFQCVGNVSQSVLHGL